MQKYKVLVMNKKIILLTSLLGLLLLTGCDKNSLPDKINALEEGNKWTLYCRMFINPEVDNDFYLEQEVKGDTVIEGCSYKKVHNTITGYEDDYKIVEPISYFCQEDNKIYEWSNSERVLNYDFGMQVGDTQYSRPGYNFRVESVSNQNMRNNISLKHLYITRLSDDNKIVTQNCDVWIEGIGSMNNGLNSCSAGLDGVSWTLLNFVYQGEELLK